MDKVREFVQIATNQNDFKFNQSAKEAEEIDIKQVLGSAFWLYVKNNQADADVIDLMNGSEYQDCNDNTVEHCGLYAVITYYLMARWKILNNSTDTQSGSVYDEVEYATVVSRNQVGRIADDYREVGKTYFNQVIDFLENNKDKFTLYECDTTQPIGKTRITTF